jgi:beta-mannosidase
LTSIDVSTGWQLARTEPDACLRPDDTAGLDWLPAHAPGTAASALRAAGLWWPGDERDFDADDWWFRTRFEAEPPAEGEELVLALDGIATITEVYLNGERLLDSDSMFAAHRRDVTGRVGRTNQLSIRCRALTPILRVSRRPRARWRTRLVSQGNLRLHRTMLLGRAPGFAAGPAAVGPWKPVRLERREGIAVDELRLRSSFEDGAGRVSVSARMRVLSGEPVREAVLEVAGPTGAHGARLTLTQAPGHLALEGILRVSGAEPWWPHTHGSPELYEARLVVHLGDREIALDAGRVGFRSLRSAGELERDGIRLRVNEIPIFARGAVWTPVDPTLPCSPPDQLRQALDLAVQAGMNMLRLPGTGSYEGAAFHDLCDELGILVWQDFMLANLDYPEQDPGFMAGIAREVEEVLGQLAGRPSLAVLCGGSEVAQQAAMMGLEADPASGPLYGELLPRLVAQAQVDAPYVPSTPWGGDLPFRPDRGVANYYGVGAYRRPLEDARLADVKFAAECLAFSNVPDDVALSVIEAPGGLVVHHPRWKAGVPRDAGAGWDFEDVRDHYLRLLYELDPVALRSTDHERYLEVSRQLTGEVMTEVLGEWRRAGSPCGGALVLWLTDQLPGAGWGLLDHRVRPKVAYHHVRRALAPVAVWSTDEGLGGIIVHVANDRTEPLEARLRIAMYRDFATVVEEISVPVQLGPHGSRADNVEELLGRFVDASWSYRFGPPAQDLIVLSLENSAPGRELLSQSFRFPAGRPLRRESAEALGVTLSVEATGDDVGRAIVSSRRFAYGVRLSADGFMPEDDAFSLEPGHSREVRLRRVDDSAASPSGRLTACVNALNLRGRVTVSWEPVA